MYVPLCAAWPLPEDCDALSSPAVSGVALMAASETLWHLTGQQYGRCEVLLRPCRQDCGPATPTSWWGWPGGWPRQGLSWLAAACGRCPGVCSCSSADHLVLPPDVTDVTAVVVDGAELAEGTAWTVYDGNTLVRTDGERWPMCQDWAVPVSGVGAWHVVAEVGRDVPAMGQIAVAELAQQLVLACTDPSNCRLPANVVSQTRQGLTQQFATPMDLAEADLVGLRSVDLFVRSVMRDRQGAQIWDPDDYVAPRRPGARL